MAELLGVDVKTARRIERRWDQDLRVAAIVDLKRMFPRAGPVSISRSLRRGRVGFAPKTVRLWLRHHGLLEPVKTPAPMSHELREEIRSLAGTMTIAAIARKLGLSFAVVRARIVPRRTAKKLTHKLTRDEIDDIKARAGKVTDRVLAEEYGVSKSCIQYHRWDKERGGRR